MRVDLCAFEQRDDKMMMRELAVEGDNCGSEEGRQCSQYAVS